MAKDLRIPSDKIPWIVSAFALSSGCLLLLFGRLADLYGRKLVWTVGGLWIMLLSLGCAFSRTGVQLIVLRAMQGIGPAAMIPAAIGILSHSFPPSRARSNAFATFSAGAPLGSAMGNVFGGVMAEYASWRGVFYFIAGLAALIVVLGWFTIDDDSHHTPEDKRVDWVGASFVTAGLVFIMFALSDAPTTGWSSPLIISLLIIGVVLIGAFLGWEYYLIHRTSFPPLMPLEIWTRAHGQFAAMQAVAFMEWACFNTLITWAMLYYQNYVGLGPVKTMIRFLPMPATGIICNLLVALVVGRINGAYLLGLGVGATSVAALLFAIIQPSAPYWAYGFPAAIICVFGADFAFACGTLFIAKVALPSEQSVAGALFQTLTALGTSFGLAVTTIGQVAGMDAEARRMGIHVDTNATALEIPKNVLLQGYRIAQWTSFACGVVGLLIVIIFLHGIGIVGSKDGKQKEDVEEVQQGDIERHTSEKNT
ncbi:MFS general substrate transporter [Serendipita vermifera]|nr:MFS general substrate transporter [Serendipita vermifera]